MKKKIFFIVIFILITFVSISGFAAPPKTVFYQGRLTNDTGVPLDGTFDLSFELHNDPSAGSKVWPSSGDETFNNVDVTRGVYSVYLGSNNPLDPSDFGETLWLQIKVNGNNFSPRTELSSMPYAFNAFRLGGKDATSYETETHAVEHAGNFLSASGDVLNVQDNWIDEANTDLGDNLVWDAGENNVNVDSGPGSGLNADFLDGEDWGSVPDRTDQWVNESGDIMTGNLDMSGNTILLNGGWLSGNGSNDLTITNNGEVGINTASPVGKVHILGKNVEPALDTAPLVLQEDGDNDQMFLGGDEIDAPSSDGGLFLQNNNPNDVYMVTGGGSVGIRTNTTDAPLDIGQQGFIGFNNNDGDYYLGGGNTPDAETSGIHLETGSNPPDGSSIFTVESSGGSERLRVEHLGSVEMDNNLRVRGFPSGPSYITDESSGFGVGTSNPTEDLHINDMDGSGFSTIQIGSVEEIYDAGANFLSTNNADFRVEGESLFVDNRVGIGTESPGEELDVRGQGVFVQQVNFEDPGDADQTIFHQDADGDFFSWNVDQGNSNDLNLLYNDSTIGWFRETDGVYVDASDSRIKSNISGINSVLPEIHDLNPRSYTLNRSPESGKHFGFVAQEVEKVFPSIVSQKKGYKFLAYQEFIPIAIRAIQEQQTQINKMQNRIQSVKNSKDSYETNQAFYPTGTELSVFHKNKVTNERSISGSIKRITKSSDVSSRFDKKHLDYGKQLFQSQSSLSLREGKQDIKTVDTPVLNYLMNDIRNLELNLYSLKNPKIDRQQYHLGTLVRNAPDYITNSKFSGISLYDYATLAMAGVKYNDNRINEIEKRTRIIHEFGSESTQSGQLQVDFPQSFTKQIPTGKTPVINLTPTSSETDLYIETKSRDGFQVVNKTGNKFSLDWTAKVELATEKKNIRDFNIPSDILKKLNVDESIERKKRQKFIDSKSKRIKSLQKKPPVVPPTESFSNESKDREVDEPIKK